MPNTFISASIATGLTIEAGHITQSADAFTGTEAYDIAISGSLTNTGPATLTGLTNLVASDASNLTLEINESASFEFLTGAPNSGSFIVQTSPDTGIGSLQSYFGQGIASAAGQDIPNQAFGITYTSGSSASEGELTMVIGKRDLSNLGLANQNNFYVAYEPGGTFTNVQGELEFFVGEHLNVGSGVLSVFRGGASAITQTSSFAGYFSSSAFPNQQQFTRPFAISTLSQVNDSNPAFVINKNITDLTTSNFSVDYGGNVSASGHLAVDDIHANNFRLMAPSDATAGPFPMIKTTGALAASTGKIFIGDPDEADTGAHLLIDPVNEQATFSAMSTTISGSLTVNQTALILGGKPVVTHTTSPISASLATTGRYHTVGGNLTCSIVQGVNLEIGAEFEFFQSSSAGNFLFESASGVTVISKNGSMRLAQQGSSAVLKRVAGTHTYHLMGDLT